MNKIEGKSVEQRRGDISGICGIKYHVGMKKSASYLSSYR